MPLRAFGDVRFKWSRELQQSILNSLDSGVDLDSLNLYQYTLPNYFTPPYLDVTPEITYHKLRPQDRFLILGTDGLWDELRSEDAVRIVGEHLSGIHLQVCLLRECEMYCYYIVSTQLLYRPHLSFFCFYLINIK